MTLKWITRIVVMLLLSMGVRFVVISSVIDFKVRSKAKSRIRDGETFIEWFLYSRFRTYIPPILLFWYFTNFILCVVAVVITIVWVLITGDSEAVTMANDIFLVIILTPLVLYGFMYRVICGRDMSKLFDRNKRYYKKKKKHPLQM